VDRVLDCGCALEDLFDGCWEDVSVPGEYHEENYINSRDPESIASASYNSSRHLSRALSPLDSILTPSVLLVRTAFGSSGITFGGALGSGVDAGAEVPLTESLRCGGGASGGRDGAGSWGDDVLDLGATRVDACFLTIAEKCQAHHM
jgi:hypothetical protein